MFQSVLALRPMGRELLRIDVETSETSMIVDGLDSFPDGIVIDPRGEYVYWTNMGMPRPIDKDGPLDESNLDFDIENGSIEKVRLDGTGRATILPAGRFVTGKQLAGAWNSGRLYWCDREGAAVRSVRLNGTDLRDEVIVGRTEAEQHDVRNECIGIAVDEWNGCLYWTQKGPAKGGEGRIFRTSLQMPAGETAATRKIETLWTGLPEPIDLELDLDSSFIYWTDRGLEPHGNSLNRAVIPPFGEAGGTVTMLAAGFHEAIGLAVDTVGGIAYVGDLSGEIRAVDLYGGKDHVVTKLSGQVTGIAGL